MPKAVDWPEKIFTAPESDWSFLFSEEEYPLSELNLEIVDPGLEEQLRFAIVSEENRIELELQLFEQTDEIPNYRFVVHDEVPIEVRSGGRVQPQSATEFFYSNPPVFWFSDGSSLVGNQYVELKSAYPPYDTAKIQAWDWSGVDIQREAQGETKDRDSVQGRVLRELEALEYSALIDDHGKGEAADIVTIRLIGDSKADSRIHVEFYHCKASQKATPGERIKDLYEVCGQAQKSIFWMSSAQKRTDLFTHLLRREAERRELEASSRFEVGNEEELLEMREMSRVCPVSLKIFVVQPGVSKSDATVDQLQLLAVTEHYLMETYQLGFGVIASE